MPRAEPTREQIERLRARPDMVAVEGLHALKHALRFGAAFELALTTDRANLVALAGDVAPDVVPALTALVRQATPELMAVATPRPPRTDVVGFARRPAVDLDGVLAAAIRPVVLLDNPRNLGNLGAVVRVAAAAGAAAVLTTGDHDPWAAPALRGSAGLHFALPVLRVRSLPARGRPIVAVDPDGDPLGAEPMPAGAVYAFGSERHGLSEAVRAAASIRVAIPMRSGVSSLNLATAVAVALYHPMVS